MGATNFNGPVNTYGDMGLILNSSGTVLVNDPNSDSSPNVFFQGIALPDARYTFNKEKIGGYTGVLPAMLSTPDIIGVSQIPATHSAVNIAAAQNATNGTALTLAAASTTTATGAAVTNIPIIPFSGGLNSGTPVTATVLDFGFAFGTCVAGSGSIVVADSNQFMNGMPLVIAGVGTSSAGAYPLLTQVTGIVDATHITVFPVPVASLNPAAIGCGNLWGPSENGFPLPTAHLPYFAKGPGLFLDPRQTVARGIVITCNSASGVGGAVTVSGYDVYWQPMTETITTAPATALATYGKKAFKAIASVTPAFTDGTYTYSVGTSDEFGFALRSDLWELQNTYWNGASLTASTGWLTADLTTPATSTTGDERGTFLVSAIGNGTGATANASNGTVSSLAMTGRRLMMVQNLSLYQQIFGRAVLTPPVFGVTPA